MSKSANDIRFKSGDLEKDKNKNYFKAWADNQLYNVFKQSQEFYLYDKKVPELVKLISDCFSQTSSYERQNVLVNYFYYNKYIQYLSSEPKQKEIKANVKKFFAAIPDRNSNGNWCTRVLDLMDISEQTETKEKIKILTEYYESNLKPYYNTKVNEFFEAELMQYIERYQEKN